ncbi:MAG: anti-sigma factor, partial [Chloroflexota bacterium]|nr:anti-sigma factor [Chloroflexota bacterium]
MDCREAEGLLPSYTFHTLGQEEEALVEAHISSCPWCSALARQAEAATSALADAFPRIEPPSGLKARVLRQAQREGPRAARGGWSWRGLFAPPALAASATAMVLLLAAAVALSALSFVRAEGLRRDNALLDTKLTSTQQMMRQERSLAFLMATPGSRTILLSGTEADPEYRGMLMLDSEGKQAILVAVGLDALPPDRAYQAWLVK